MMRGDESYAGARSYFRFDEAARELTGHALRLPHAPGTRRRAHPLRRRRAARRGGALQRPLRHDARQRRGRRRDAESTCRSPTRSTAHAPFGGDIDLPRLRRGAAGARSGVRLVVMTVTNNAVGGQAVSLENLRARLRALPRRARCRSSSTPAASPRTPTGIRRDEPAERGRSLHVDRARDVRPLRRLHDEREEGRHRQHRRACSACATRRWPSASAWS